MTEVLLGLGVQIYPRLHISFDTKQAGNKKRRLTSVTRYPENREAEVFERSFPEVTEKSNL